MSGYPSSPMTSASTDQSEEMSATLSGNTAEYDRSTSIRQSSNLGSASRQHATILSSHVHETVARKRVGKACDCCRIKKSKCDGRKPCSRCILDDKICTFTERKRSKEKTYPGGYVELLQNRIDLLQQALEEMVVRSVRGDSTANLVNADGHISINHVVEQLTGQVNNSGSYQDEDQGTSDDGCDHREKNSRSSSKHSRNALKGSQQEKKQKSNKQEHPDLLPCYSVDSVSSASTESTPPPSLGTVSEGSLQSSRDDPLGLNSNNRPSIFGAEPVISDLQDFNVALMADGTTVSPTVLGGNPDFEPMMSLGSQDLGKPLMGKQQPNFFMAPPDKFSNNGFRSLDSSCGFDGLAKSTFMSQEALSSVWLN